MSQSSEQMELIVQRVVSNLPQIIRVLEHTQRHDTAVEGINAALAKHSETISNLEEGFASFKEVRVLIDDMKMFLHEVRQVRKEHQAVFQHLEKMSKTLKEIIRLLGGNPKLKAELQIVN